ncbi:hypothetical protein STAN_5617 [Streptomyces sp. CBMAI 2042]|nr:hypothetical protein STAN_5617 [Streptomyces sp. CBMAI 2042]
METAQTLGRIVVRRGGPGKGHEAWLTEHWEAVESAQQGDAQGHQMEL